MHFWLYDQHRLWAQQMMDTDETIMKKNSFIKDFLASFVTSLYLHPLHVLEARYILNNRIPTF